jgi:hypothetical protein
VDLVEEFGEGVLSQDVGRESQERLEVDGDEVGEGIDQIGWGGPVLEGQSVILNQADDAFMRGGYSSSACFPLVSAFSWDGLVVGVDLTAEIVVALDEKQSMGWVGLYVLRGDVEAGDAGSGYEEVEGRIHSIDSIH